MYDILYGWFEKNKRWLFQLEEAIMTLENGEYTPESILQAKESKRADGKTLKGCVAQLIAYVKVDLVNQIRDSGVKKHGMSITKSRPKEEMLKMESDGKYVQRKKGQVFLSEVMHKVEKKIVYQQNEISKRIIIIAQMKKMKKKQQHHQWHQWQWYLTMK
jgi:hypothetical protein